MKEVDSRITKVIKNGVENRHRSMFVIVGDNAGDQVVTFHGLLSNALAKSRPSVLWCSKNRLDFTSYNKKLGNQFKKFIESEGLTCCMYKHSDIILGNTFGMCILQDFEAMTPNLLARTIETVEGGGLIVLMLPTVSSLSRIYKMSMDVHERFQTESHSEVTGRFNERFILSLASCKSCVVMDDELNILPISLNLNFEKDFKGLSKMQRDLKNVKEQASDGLPVGPFLGKCCTLDRDFEGLSKTQRDLKKVKELPSDDGLPVGPLLRKCCTSDQDSDGRSEMQQGLKNLKEQLSDDFPVGPLIGKCCTLDQAKAAMKFLGTILDKTLRTTVAMLAARGRGKSSVLGLSIAGAISAGYSNILVTAPNPENLKTLFVFVLKGLAALDYKEHTDYEVVKTSNSEFKNVIVRVDIYRKHRQTIQYIQPFESEQLSQVDLLVVDEAAAIPLPVVKSLFGPYLIFLSSTINGYEGTGRSLSLKLMQQLKQQSCMPNQMPTIPVENSLSGRTCEEVVLSESVRYASGDPVESWLHNLLCLDATSYIPPLTSLPPRNECDLYYVSRDTLFSYHEGSETVLQRMMALYVASHYKNSPNDLQLIADAPAHHLFVLLGPADESQNRLPDILCVIQVCLEGDISSKSIKIIKGQHPFGDQIPWKFSEQFQDTFFPSLSGARIVRIAVHPQVIRLGYGSSAVELLTRYYEGELTPTMEMDFEEVVESSSGKHTEPAEKPEVALLKEIIKPKKNLPPLFVHLRERKPEKLNYIGVSFGLTLDLISFWKKHNFVPFYVCQIPNAVTGEHTCMVIRRLNNNQCVFPPFYHDFKSRFMRLLGSSFKEMEYKLCMSIFDPKVKFGESEQISSSSGYLTSLNGTISPHNMKRLESYVHNLADFHLILDLVPKLAHLYFRERLPVPLTYVQASILLCMGLKNQDLSYTQREMELKREQILIKFRDVMKKFYKYLYDIASNELQSTLPRLTETVMTPHSVSVDKDLDDAAKEVEEKMKTETEGLKNPKLLQTYAFTGRNIDFENALQNREGKVPSSGLVSIKSKSSKSQKDKKRKQSECSRSSENRRQDGSRSRSKMWKKS